MSWGRWQAAGAQAGALDRMSRAERITAAELYERYLEDLFRYVLQRVPSQEEAEDIAAEVFAAAFAALPRFRGDCPPYLWLLSIARRKIIDAGRRRTARREMLASELADTPPQAAALWEALALAEGPEAAMMRQEARRELDELIAQLNTDQREALLLHYMERLPVAEIAMVMGRSPRAVYSLLHRARETLRRRGRDAFPREDEGPNR